MKIRAFVVSCVVGASLVQSNSGLASLLRTGTRLTYGSAGRDQAPWVVDSVQRDVTLAGRSGCSRVYIRTRADQTSPDARTLCRSADTLFSWNAAASSWRADRPLGAGMTLAVRQPSGATLQYLTSELGDTIVSGHRLPFVRTTIVTVDTAGRVTRRLRERYSAAIATALGGVFEVPDSTAAGGWRETQRFELVRLEIP